MSAEQDPKRPEQPRAEETAPAPGSPAQSIPAESLPLPGLSRRQMRRTPIHGLLLAIDAVEPGLGPWVVDAIDINSQGMGVVLPPELPEGAEILLSFKFEDFEFSRLPATVLHRSTVSGAVRFSSWPAAERLKLLEYLVGTYETVDD